MLPLCAECPAGGSCGRCLKPVPFSECPGAHASTIGLDSLKALKTCDLVEVGEVCEADGECGTEDTKNNCVYSSRQGSLDMDIYRCIPCIAAPPAAPPLVLGNPLPPPPPPSPPPPPRPFLPGAQSLIGPGGGDSGGGGGEGVVFLMLLLAAGVAGAAIYLKRDHPLVRPKLDTCGSLCATLRGQLVQLTGGHASTARSRTAPASDAPMVASLTALPLTAPPSGSGPSMLSVEVTPAVAAADARKGLAANDSAAEPLRIGLVGADHLQQPLPPL